MLESRSAARRRSRHGWLKNSTEVCCCSSHPPHKKEGVGAMARITLTLCSCWSGPCVLRCLCRNSHPLRRDQGGRGVPPLLLLCIRLIVPSIRQRCSTHAGVPAGSSGRAAAAGASSPAPFARESSLGFVPVVGQSVHVHLRCVQQSSLETELQFPAGERVSGSAPPPSPLCCSDGPYTQHRSRRACSSSSVNGGPSPPELPGCQLS